MKDVLFGLCVVILIFWGISSCDDRVKQNCKDVYNGKPHVEEKLMGTTSDGCQIKEATSYNESCGNLGTVYITNCAGVAWDERVGKTTHRRATVNEQNK